MANDEQKRLVRSRARHKCEYCRASELVTGYAFHIEHIVPRNRGGKDHTDNYALACMPCNRAKSDHLTGIDPKTESEVRLFDPRNDAWTDHFLIVNEIQIKGKTPIGRATANRLQLNQIRQLEARRLWVELKVFP